MLDKIGATLKAIIADIRGIKSDVSALQKLPKPKDGENGVSPAMADIVSEVLGQIPKPKDGVSPDIDAVAFKVLGQIPKPKDGEKGVSHAMADIVSEVLGQIPKPKDGEKGVSPDIDAIVRTVLAKIPAPKVLAAVKQPAPTVRHGKNGVSITKVKLEKGNKLAVWLDGVRRQIGVIDIPKPAASFTPGGGGGGGSKKNPFNPTTDMVMERLIEGVSLAANQQPTGTGIANALMVEFGAAQNSASDPVSLDAAGVATFHTAGMYRIKVVFQFGRTGGSQTSNVLFRFLVGGVQVGRSVGVKLGNADDLRYIDIDNWFNVPAGTTLVTEIMRDSAGNNSGGLFQTTPTDEGAGTWNVVPSAVLRIERLVGAP